MIKALRFLQLILLMHIIMSTDCRGFPIEDNRQIESTTKIYMQNSSNFHINDTIWIKGFRSSKNFDTNVKDSVIQNYAPFTNIGISKLITNNSFNLIGAVNKFEIIATQMQSEDFCVNRSIRTQSSINNSNHQFKYEIGLIPKETGDFVFSFDDKFLFQNVDKRQNILTNYPVNDSFKMVWEVCVQTIPRRDISNNDVFIKVN
ncbi:hypothetical protein [Chryseobacterium sp.]|uniref:hypothetical protein n=1 Tax=Chryseobacterium sp. TaxID=1871047 RepID=UPI003891118E